MTIDIDTLFRVLTLLLAVGSGIYAWIASQSKGSADEIRRVHDDVAGLEVRVQKSETRIEQMPGKDEIHALDKAITKLEGEMSSVTAALQAMQRTMDRLESFLLEQDAPKRATRRRT